MQLFELPHPGRNARIWNLARVRRYLAEAPTGGGGEAKPILFLRLKLLNKRSEMRGDRGRESLVLVLKALPNC